MEVAKQPGVPSGPRVLWGPGASVPANLSAENAPSWQGVDRTSRPHLARASQCTEKQQEQRGDGAALLAKGLGLETQLSKKVPMTPIGDSLIHHLPEHLLDL